MSVSKRTIAAAVLLAMTAFCLRGPLFRALFHFADLRVLHSGMILPRPTNLTARTPIPASVDTCIDEALAQTAEALTFSTGKVPNNAQGAIDAGRANCVGYAAVFTRFCGQHLAAIGQDQEWEVVHLRASLYRGSFRVHRLFSSAFWNDHDICAVMNRSTGQYVLVDPSLFDVMRIRRVSGPAN